MGETSIEWTDRSVNPIRARNKRTGAVGHYCELYSSGCAHCYASNFQPRFKLPKFHGKQPPQPLTPDERGCISVNDQLEVFLDTDVLGEVLRRRKPTKWFWCDMTDMFGWWVPDEWIDRCFAVMALTPQHTHQVLTKRAERMHACLQECRIWNVLHEFVGPTISTHDDVERWCREHGVARNERDRRLGVINKGGGFYFGNQKQGYDSWPLSNVWLGVSCENQAAADERIPWLLKTPATVRFVSAEPLLGPIDIAPWTGSLLYQCRCKEFGGYHRTESELIFSGGGDYTCPTCMSHCRVVQSLDWVIVGGESGHGARPMHPDWARSLRDQCQAAGVAYFFKQWGGHVPFDEACGGPIAVSCSGHPHFRKTASYSNGETHSIGECHYFDSGNVPVYRVGKKAAGRLLDGRTWDEFPRVEVGV